MIEFMNLPSSSPNPEPKCPEKLPKTDQNHPIWRLLNLVVVAVVVIWFSYTSASNFDETEAEMIRNIILLIGAWEGIKTFLPTKKDKGGEG